MSLLDNFNIRNNTGSDILIPDLGVVIPASTTLDVERMFEDFDLRHSTDLRGFIASGDLDVLIGGEVMPLAQFDDYQTGAHAGGGFLWVSPTSSIDLTVSGVVSLNAASGTVTLDPGTHTTVETDTVTNTITVDSFDDVDVDSLTASGTTVTGSVQFESQGGISITADAGTDTVTISGGSTVGELVGSLFQIDFTNGGNTSNVWLAVSDSNLGGNTTPWTNAFPCRLAGMSFSNRNDGTDLDLEFHVARVGDGNSTTTEFIWEVRDCRTAYKTDIPLDTLVLNAGDKVSIYAQDQGASGRDVWFGVFWEITTRDEAENCEDWSGNIS